MRERLTTRCVIGQILLALSFIAVIRLGDLAALSHNLALGCLEAYTYRVPGKPEDGTVFLHCPNDAYGKVQALAWTKKGSVD